MRTKKIMALIGFFVLLATASTMDASRIKFTNKSKKEVTISTGLSIDPKSWHPESEKIDSAYVAPGKSYTRTEKPTDSIYLFVQSSRRSDRLDVDKLKNSASFTPKQLEDLESGVTVKGLQSKEIIYYDNGMWELKNWLGLK